MVFMSHSTRRSILLIQLPIPPLGPDPIRGNVPLAAAYLKLFAEKKGLGSFYAIDILSAEQASTLGDQALVAAIAEREPWLVGFTCYLWNIERTLWIAQQLKRLLPKVRIVLGGPEITADNAWVLNTLDYDHAVIGEGEQTFANLLLALIDDPLPPVPIAGLYVPPRTSPRYLPERRPAFRTPMPDLNQLGSPYLAGILDAADEQMLLLETTRGCVFKCKFCYYPKSYDKQYYLSREQILANLHHARERGAQEVFLLDPTLNQRKDFADLVRLLIEGNPGQTFRYFGELRGEGITPATARLLREANFTEVEVGLQSIEPEAMLRMDRNNNLRAFERGVRAMLDEGIRVRVDLIIGLPGDTVESVRRGLRYLHQNGLYSDLQVFNLAILPGTAFREEAGTLGLIYQPTPPYYVLQTPTLRPQDLYELMQEAQELFDIEFDARPQPVLDFAPQADLQRVCHVDLDRPETGISLDPQRGALAFTLWLHADHLARRQQSACVLVRKVLEANPFSTLQVVLEPRDLREASRIPEQLPLRLIHALLQTCHAVPTYLDKFYALQPGATNGAKRLLVLLPAAQRTHCAGDWLDEVGELASIVWQTDGDSVLEEEDLSWYEYTWSPQLSPRILV